MPNKGYFIQQITRRGAGTCLMHARKKDKAVIFAVNEKLPTLGRGGRGSGVGRGLFDGVQAGRQNRAATGGRGLGRGGYPRRAAGVSQGAAQQVKDAIALAV